MFQNHFWSIGFQLASAEQYKELANTAAEKGELIGESNGLRYECWRIKNVELWLHTEQESKGALKKILNLTLHYAGNSCIPADLRHRIQRPNDSPLDRAYTGVMPDEGYPFVFDVPYIDSEPTVPGSATLQLTAFAHRLEVFENESTYEKREAKGWAVQSFVPCGMFRPGGEKIEPPVAMAMFSGIVKEAREEVNEYSGHKFQYALVNSYLADFDVVVGPDVYDLPLAPGNVVSGTFWLSGKLLR